MRVGWGLITDSFVHVRTNNHRAGSQRHALMVDQEIHGVQGCNATQSL